MLPWRHVARSTILVVFLFALSASIASAQKSRPAAEVIKEGAKNGGCDYDPYQKLQQLGVIGAGAQVVPRTVNGQPQEGIDIALACRVSKMFEHAGRCAKITSAYRSPQKQQSLCGSGRTGCAPPGTSCHQYGLAVDISGPCLQKLRQIAPQFQLIQNPIPGDPYHFQCAEHRGASRRSCTGPCNGGIAITPDPNALANAGNYSPSSSLANMFRQALGLNQQPQQPPPPPIQPQTVPQQQQPTQYFPPQGSNLGTATGSGAKEQSPVSALSPDSQKYLGINGSSQPPTSIADQLLELAYGTSSPSQPQNTGTTVPLILNPNDSGSLRAQPTTTAYIDPVSNNIPVGSLQPSQTFTSSDLAFAPELQHNTFGAEPTGVYAVLEAVKQTLLRALQILRPMGIRAALQGEDTLLEVYSE